MPGHQTNGRRTFLRSAAAAGSAVALGGLAGCTDLLDEDQTLTVAVYGGIFQEVMDEHLFEPFNEEVDFEVESEEQPTAEEALAQYDSAVGAGEAPVDVAIMSTIGVLRGVNGELWHLWDGEDEFDNIQYISDDLIEERDGGIASIGALSWYINLVQNTDVYEDPIESWEALWDDEYDDSLGLLGLASNSFLLDVTAELYFGGQEVLKERDGVEEVFEELEGVTDQVNFWYENEAEFQQRLRDAEVPAGMLYSDITNVMQADGAPVRSNFPEEGSIIDSGSWVVLDTSDLTEEARQFIDYASRPDVQDTLAENLFTAPVIDLEHSELDDETYERVAGPGPEEAIVPYYDLYVEEEDWVNERWEEFIIG
ncbi:ABC transporter substrate-binding protein [Halorubrum vacuolatum]|uniref:Putative spermidine/putrescine transport system substrate-binding protein n=1 Tax=Halorubrum vacuolatum TaxID=63740 RepID=A0A238X6Y7_HALVU|nr:extracellular solute-binding protein [Halorubrum vacuolatum]SNR54470.1 putative spermidine/putrescine transport system substrate-binding protein [Halorubrum vacuolatum]